MALRAQANMVGMLAGYSNPVPEIRRICVQRDGFIEYKTWFIFTWDITGDALINLSRFLEVESRRFCESEVTPKRLKSAAEEYSSLVTTLPELPPRLSAIPQHELSMMGTRLVTKGLVIYGDSVGGLAPAATGDVGTELIERIHPSDEVLFSPGVLARLRCELGGQTHYLFQLAVKNLRKSGTVFYKAIGGHLRFRPTFEEVIQAFSLQTKTSAYAPDARDVVFRVRGRRLREIIDIFENESMGADKERLFVRPIVSMYDELWEELGPIDADDGISLFSDIEMRRDFIRA